MAAELSLSFSDVRQLRPGAKIVSILEQHMDRFARRSCLANGICEIVRRSI